MAKINKGIEDSTNSRKVSSTGESKSSVGTLKSSAPQKVSSAPVAGKSPVTPLLTHKQIEERARLIWQQKGCPVGQDDKNWQEAEAQLRKELAAK